MSYDFVLEVDVGGERPLPLEGFDCNYTYNVSPMFRLAFCTDGQPEDGEGINQLHGLTGQEALPLLTRAIDQMMLNPEAYRVLNPESGWGNYEGALATLRMLARWCRKAPRATIGVY